MGIEDQEEHQGTGTEECQGTGTEECQGTGGPPGMEIEEQHPTDQGTPARAAQTDTDTITHTNTSYFFMFPSISLF